MPKKTAPTKITYRTHPFVLFLIIVLCAVTLYVVLYQEFLIEEMALTLRISIMQKIPEVMPVPTVSPSPDHMKFGY